MKKIEIDSPFHHILKTPFGPVALLWSIYKGQPKIMRILLSKPGASANQLIKTLFSDSVSYSCAEVDLVANQIAEFLSGSDIRFSLDIACLNICTKFQQKVLLAEHGIPRGSVSTYQRIAGYLGVANGARAVGTALAKNPFPILIPCHRAIRTDGTLGGYQGGLEMKRTLLEMEGIRFDKHGQVATKNFFY